MILRVGYLKDEDQNFEVIAILDEHSEDTFEVQASFAYDDQDVALGQDTCCVVRNGATCYGESSGGVYGMRS